MPRVRLCQVRFFRQPMHTRFPFHYGIAQLTELPHLFVEVTVEVDGKPVVGHSADGLPPKWFTKNPHTTFDQDDLPEMLCVIGHATQLAQELGERPSFFAWWHALYSGQLAWARDHGRAALLAGLGVSLLERAVLDAMCRAQKRPFHRLIASPELGIDLQALRPELPPQGPLAPPQAQVSVRHTVGLADPLTPADIAPDERPADNLPYTLEENIDRYGLRYFKVKLCGQIERDRARLETIARLLADKRVRPPALTLDGNEMYPTLDAFRQSFEQLRGAPAIRSLFDQGLLFVEQPVARDQALGDGVELTLAQWPDAPPIIIDESDADLASLPRALEIGYAGTSHKNCKGIVKGLLARATLRHAHPQAILSAEDLGNVGPVALLQDLAVVAALGIEHVERNGHHYFAGLDAFPQDLQAQMLARHGDLYERRGGFATLAIRDGTLALASVNRAPFGLAGDLDLTPFEPWEWS